MRLRTPYCSYLSPEFVSVFPKRQVANARFVSLGLPWGPNWPNGFILNPPSCPGTEVDDRPYSSCPDGSGRPEGCGLRYLVGGSLASSLSGEPRSTLDVDLVVSISENDVQLFVDKLGDEFYAEPDSLRRAIRDRSSANIIHYATSMKVDLFIAGGSVLDEQQMNRRQRVQVSTDPDRHLYFYTPEDILLQKLSWYRAGNEVSDRQWRDILGIVLVQSSLDDTYLRDGAEKLGVVDLLDRAMLEGRNA